MKSSASVVQLGPWIRGIQNLYDPAMTPKGCVVEADNVLIESDGSITPRAGYTPVSTNVHSLFRHNGKAYGIFNDLVCELYDDGARPIQWWKYGAPQTVTAAVAWGVLNDEPVFTNPSVLARITPQGVKRIGVEKPSGSISDLELTLRNEFVVAYTFVNFDGEEGPATFTSRYSARPSPVEPTVARAVRYVGEGYNFGDNIEEVFYGSGLMRDDSGRQLMTFNKERMPGGHYVRQWRGRLLVARGRTLYFSDPLYYGLYDASGGFVTFESKIDFIESVENGVFVALRNMGVHFLAGPSPDKWERRVAAVEPAQPGAVTLVPTALMALEMQSKPEWVAVWFTHKGFAVGLPSGNVVYPQADLLSGLPLGTGSLHFEEDRLIVLSQ